MSTVIMGTAVTTPMAMVTVIARPADETRRDEDLAERHGRGKGEPSVEAELVEQRRLFLRLLLQRVEARCSLCHFGWSGYSGELNFLRKKTSQYLGVLTFSCRVLHSFGLNSITFQLLLVSSASSSPTKMP